MHVHITVYVCIFVREASYFPLVEIIMVPCKFLMNKKVLVILRSQNLIHVVHGWEVVDEAAKGTLIKYLSRVSAFLPYVRCLANYKTIDGYFGLRHKEYRVFV